MSNEKVYVDAVNVQILVDMKQDLSNFSATKFVVRKPSGDEVEWITGKDGTFLRYITVDGDLDEAGVYYCQPFGQLGNWEGLGKTFNFRIYNKWR